MGPEPRVGDLPLGRKVALVEAVKKEVPSVEQFAPQFMTFSKTNNKPSTVYAKEWMLRVHVVPYFGHMPLDKVGPADIEAYKAKKLDEKQVKKRINNHLAALRKLLNLAVEWGVIEKAPKVKAWKLLDGPPGISSGNLTATELAR